MPRLHFLIPVLATLAAPLPVQASEVLVQRCNIHVGGGTFVSGLWVTTRDGRSYHAAGQNGLDERATFSRRHALAYLAEVMDINPARTSYSSDCAPQHEMDQVARITTRPPRAAISIEEQIERPYNEVD